MKRLQKRIFSLMLALMLVTGLVSGFPLGALAEEAQPGDSATQAVDTAGEEALASQEAETTEEDASPTDIEYAIVEPETFEVAAASTDVDINDPYKVLGLSTPAPERAEDAPTPLGDAYTVTFSELLAAGNLAGDSEFIRGKLFGNGANQNYKLNKQAEYGNYDGFMLYRSDYPDDPNRRVFSFSSDAEGAVAMEGDFSASGRKRQMAMLSYWQHHAMELWVGDAAAIAGGALDMYRIASFSGTGANDNNSMTAPNDDLHLKTGDVNGDGIDEIVLLIPDYSNSTGSTSRLVVLGRADAESFTGEDAGDDVTWNTNSGWEIIYDNKFNIGFNSQRRQGGTKADNYNYVNTVSHHALAVGDLDGDGRDDIALAGSKLTVNGYKEFQYFTLEKDYLSDKSQASLSVLISPSEGDFSTDTVTAKTYNYNSESSSSNPLFGSTSAGALLPALDESILGDAKDKPNLCLLPASLGLDIVNADDTNGNELLVGVNLFASHGKTLDNTSHYKSIAPDLGYQVHQLSYASETATLSQAASLKPLQVLTNTIYSVSGGSKGKAKISDRFMSLYVLKSQNFYTNILELYKMLPVGMRVTAAQMFNLQTPVSIIVGNNRHDRVAGGNSFNLVPPNYSQFDYFPSLDVSVRTLRPAIMNTMDDDGNTAPAYGYMIHYQPNKTYQTSRSNIEFITMNTTVNPSDSASIYKDRLTAGRFKASGGVIACLPDTDNDMVRMRYKKYDYIYTDPVVLAAISAPPYVQDIINGYLSMSETSIGFTVTTEVSETDTSITSLGAYAAVNAEIGCLFASAVVEAETEYKHSWSTEFTQTLSHSVSDTYGAVADDTVLLYTCPMELYYYEMEYPVDSDASVRGTCDYVVYVPSEPKVTMVPLYRYNQVYEMYPDLLDDIDGDIFKHDVGYPDTYYRSAPEYYDGFEEGETKPAPESGSVASEVATEKSETTSTTATNEVSFKIGGGAKAGISNSEVTVTAGVTMGVAETRGQSITKTNGVKFTGNLQGNENHRYDRFGFDATLFKYNYTGKQNFLVLDYVVKMDRGNKTWPYLPKEFWVDNEKTTSDSITLRWAPAPGDNPSAPGDNPSAPMSYGIFIKDNANEFILSSDEVGFDSDSQTYSCTISGLKKSTWYEFRMGTRRKGGEWGPESPSLLASTNPDDYTYRFSTQPEDLTIYPGRTAQLRAELDYNTGASQEVSYRWQKSVETYEQGKKVTKWQEVSGEDPYEGEDTNVLTFTSPNSGQAGRYRVRATLTSGETEKYFYSDAVDVDFRKNNVSIFFVGEPVLSANSDQVTLSAQVEKIDTVEAEPDGKAVFTLTTPSGSSVKMAAEVTNGTASTTINLTEQGAYSATASYMGDACFGLADAESIRFSTDARALIGSVKLSSSSVAYGDELKLYPSRRTGGTAWELCVGADTTVELRKYNSNGTLSSGAGGATCETFNSDYYILKFTEVGRYRVTTTVSKNGKTAEPVSQYIKVVPRKLTYTVDDVVRYMPGDKISKSDLTIRLTSGSRASDDSHIYTNASLALFDSTGKQISDKSINNTLPAGEYTIKPATRSTDERYSVTVEEGTYTVVENATLYSVTFGVENGDTSKGSVVAQQPKSLLTGGNVIKDSAVLLKAVPNEGYKFSHWVATPENAGLSTGTGGTLYSIDALKENVSVIAVFVPEDPVRGVNIDPPTTSVAIGTTKTFTAIVETTGEDKGVQWSLLGAQSGGSWIDPDSGLLTVSENELSNILKVRATSTADPGVYSEATVNVTGQAATFLLLDSNSLSHSDLTLYIGDAQTLTLYQSGGLPTELTFTAASANGKVAEANTADKTLTVTGKGAGTTTIKLTVGSQSWTLPVRVVDSDGMKVTLTKSSLNLVKGKTGTITASYLPTKMTYSEITWKSSNESVATVDRNGKVQAVGAGQAVISVYARPITLTTYLPAPSCVVNVTAPAKSVALATRSGPALAKTSTIAMGGIIDANPVIHNVLPLRAIVTPSDSTDYVKWTSSNIKAATVDSSGTVTGVAPGSTTITATAGSKKATHKVTVVAPMPSSGLTFDQKSPDLKVKQSLSLKVSVPDREVDGKSYPVTNKKVTWTSSAPEVATVSTKGKVTARTAGTCTITAQSVENRYAKATCTVTVVAPVTSVKFNQKNFAMTPGTSTDLSFTFNGGGSLTGELAGMELVLSDDSALVFSGSGVQDYEEPQPDDGDDPPSQPDGNLKTGKVYRITSPYETVTLVAKDDALATREKATATITAKTTHESYKKAISAPKLTVTVVKTLKQPTAPARVTNESKAPGVGTYLNDAYGFPDDLTSPYRANAPLVVGKSFTPSVVFTPKGVSNTNINWRVSATRITAAATWGNVETGLSASSFVTLDATTGKVTAIKETPASKSGTTHSFTLITLTGTTASGETFSFTFRIAVPATKLGIKEWGDAKTKSKAIMSTDSATLLDAVLTPGTATVKDVVWSSTNETIATVNSAGWVSSGSKTGTVTIKATTADPPFKTASIKVTVGQKMMDGIITNTPVNPNSPFGPIGELEMGVGGTLKLKYKLNAENSISGNTITQKYPAPANNKVVWGADQYKPDGTRAYDVISINPKTGAVKALSEGYVIVFMTYEEKTISSLNVPVSRMDGAAPVTEMFSSLAVIYVRNAAKSVKIDQPSFKVHGERTAPVVMSATIGTGGRTLSEGMDQLTWSIPVATGLAFDTADPRMADGTDVKKTVDGVEMWEYTAPAGHKQVVFKTQKDDSGTDTDFKIKVSTTNGKSHTVTAKVTKDAFTPAVQGVSLKKSATWLQIGRKEKLAATLAPTRVDNKGLVWSVAEYDLNGRRLDATKAGTVATVDASGRVTANGSGYAVVTVTSMDGAYEANCRVYCVARG